MEEFLWISRFQGIENVRPKILQDSGKDVDWGFSSCTQPLQIEIKNRRRESVGIIDGASRGREYPSWYADLIGKFCRIDETLNVACITSYLESDEALRERADELLISREPIDAVILWTYHCPGGQHLQVYAKPQIKTVLSSTLAPIPREVSAKYLRLLHLERNSDQQRILTVDEIIQFAEKHAHGTFSESL